MGDGQADQLGVGQLWWASHASSVGEQVVDDDVQCGDEVVETGVHAALQSRRWLITPTLDDLVSKALYPPPATPATLEATI
ncbi:MAG: hypothetical protein ACRDYA_14480 [Egibacteraceae bacterium]